MILKHQKKNLNPFKFLLIIPVPWVFVLTYLVGVVLQTFSPFNFLSQEGIFWVKITGIALFVTGVIFASWSLIIFRKVHTTTTPGESSKMLITKGPYRFSRNPMYVSLILAYLGEAGFLIQFWPVIVLPFVIWYVNRVVIPLEEDILKKDFKEKYENYCTQVHRWL